MPTISPDISKEVKEIIGTPFESKLSSVSFCISNKPGNNVATSKEWHSVTLFFDHINMARNHLLKDDVDISTARSILTEMRPILFNEGDNTYYKKVLDTELQMLNGTFNMGTKINVINENKEDVTSIFSKEVKALKKEIARLIYKSDLAFLYNGVLQHSDTRYSETFLHTNKKDLERIIMKNCVIVSYIIELLVMLCQPLRIFIYG